ncbi:MAG TPA: NUDIX hydrolase N-terminal domain-containing protein [Candidatus Binataceae bacterium]|nr:NUDIX hydrolase N-terminal domain-containing protein [Candidatus Binataceae bacterium]
MSQAEIVFELGRFVQRISAIARTGLAFSPGGFDAERYEELLREAARLSALMSQVPEGRGEEMFREWRDSVGEGYDGYVTTAVGCGAIVFNQHDKILMIKRPNGRWWYPTGFCDVGVSPAENVAREVREETGLIVVPLRLIGVTDSLKLGSAARHIYSMLFYCRLDGGELRPHPLEALEADFFQLERLPEPMHGTSRKWVELARQFHFDGRIDAYFDPL